MKNLIDFDIFFYTPQLNIRGKSRFPTYLGAVTTFLFLIFSIITIFYFSSNLINKTNPNYRAQDYSSREISFFDFNSYQIIPAISFLSPQDNTTINQEPLDDTIFYFTYYLAKYSYVSEGISEEKALKEEFIYLEDEPCSKELFSNIIQDRDYSEYLFGKTNISQFRCLSENSKIKINITGSWGEPLNIFFGAMIIPCNNATIKSGKVCKPREEINRKIERGAFQIGFLEKELNFEDYRRPLRSIFNLQWVRGILNMSKIVEFIIRKSNHKNWKK